jgi:iron complex transport system substrate-binding protein
MRLGWPLFLLASCAGQPPIPPAKIVSNNPCMDAVLAEVAEPAQIGAVSIWSHDRASNSAPLAWAQRFASIGTGAEDIIAARPKLAIVGQFGSTDALERAGVPHMVFGVPTTIAESQAQITSLSRAIDREAQGATLVRKIEQATQATAGLATAPSAIIWLSGGFVPGKGTLQDELLFRAGFRNASARYGLLQWDQLPLEVLVRAPPDIIFTPVGDGQDRSLALRHRVISRLQPRPIIVALPEKLLNCAGPSILKLMAIFRSARRPAA